VSFLYSSLLRAGAQVCHERGIQPELLNECLLANIGVVIADVFFDPPNNRPCAAGVAHISRRFMSAAKQLVCASAERGPSSSGGVRPGGRNVDTRFDISDGTVGDIIEVRSRRMFGGDHLGSSHVWLPAHQQIVSQLKEAR